jgi:hypothetical protein
VTAVKIEARFNGPPTSANGGYACGVAAMLFGEPAVITLTAPPPLGVDVALEEENGARVVGPAGPWALVRPLRDGDPIVTIDPVSADDARIAAEQFDVDAYRDGHVFSTCFTCGPDRSPEDGLCIFPARQPGRDGVVVWPWTPRAAHAEDGHVAEPVLWAALDCPSGLACFESSGEVFVLGRMAAVIERLPEVGEDLIVAGWRIGRDGRKAQAGSAIWDRDGNVVAAARTTWIHLTEERAAAFGSTNAT